MTFGKRDCANCKGWASTLSSRNWCDGCEEEDAWGRYESPCDCDTCMQELWVGKNADPE